MAAAKHTPGRRETQSAWGHTVFVTPPQPMPHAEWSVWFEQRALVAGYLAVIDGHVIEPAKATGSAT
jgi:hypothetical protein